MKIGIIKIWLDRLFIRPCDRPSRAADYLAPLLVLALAVLGLYGSFLRSPLVFDDFTYFGASVADDLKAAGGVGLRGLSVATFGWVRAVLGEGMVAQRSVNMALHIANVWLLFVFLLRLFNVTLAGSPSGLAPQAGRTGMTLPWLAFFGALWFALNPVAVYGVAYLAQRTLLMATLFALLTWLLLLEGLLRHQRRWLLASTLTYVLAVLSKEHAIMVPAVALALLVLLRQPGKSFWVRVGPTFLLYGLVGVFTYIQIKSGGIVGRAYEPSAAGMLQELNVHPLQAHVFSVLTQVFLYFKYLLLWMLPYPDWMSVDMLEPFVSRFGRWPQTAALLSFALYPMLAVYWLLRRGRTGLLGFALLGPWLLFATELSTVRIQETFVLYRSYLWMPCLIAALPFLFQKVAARYAFVIFSVVTVLLLPASWNRLTTFSDSFLLWDDALRLAQGHDKNTRLGRMYHNRGTAHLDAQRYEKAILDFGMGIKILPGYSPLFNDRGVAYLKTGQYWDALDDYDRAIMLDPSYYNTYLGRAQVHEALGYAEAARLDYARSCRLGVTEVCQQGQ